MFYHSVSYNYKRLSLYKPVYSRPTVFRTGTYSNFPPIQSVFHSPWIFLNKLMQITISYWYLQLFKISYMTLFEKRSLTHAKIEIAPSCFLLRFFETPTRKVLEKYLMLAFFSQNFPNLRCFIMKLKF